MAIHIVVDSTAGFSSKLPEKYKNLHSVSLNIILGDKRYKENALSAAEMFELAASSGYFPQAEAPTVEDFSEVVEPLVQSGEQVILLTVDGHFTDTFRHAQKAADLAGRDNVVVIDSGTIAGGIVYLAETALDMASDGAELTALARTLTEKACKLRTLFVAETLDFLYKNGVLGNLSAFFGTVMHKKPVVEFASGRFKIICKAGSKGEAVDDMLAELQDKNVSCAVVTHIGTEAEGSVLAARIRHEHPEALALVSCGTAALGAQLGDSSIGIIYQVE